jgi:hypothetical protein
LTTFWALFFLANEIKHLADVKSSKVVFFAKNVVILGDLLTTRVVILISAGFAVAAPEPARLTGIASIGDV